MTERNKLSKIQLETINDFLRLNDPRLEEKVQIFIIGLMAGKHEFNRPKNSA